jgi:hypothetical protein
LTLEIGRTDSAPCASCGLPSIRSSGFIYREGDAHAIYHVLAHGGESPHADLAIGVGSWEGSDAVADQSAFLGLSTTEDEIRFSFVDHAQSAWGRSRLLAHPLTAEQARASNNRDDFIEAAELVATADPAVAHVLSH